MLAFTLVLAFVASVLFTPLVKKLAFRVGAVDKPNYRKVHAKIMPRLGGLAIFLSFVVAFVVYRPDGQHDKAMLLGALIIIITGALDDMFEITAKAKLLGQLLAAASVAIYGGLQIEFITIPFIDYQLQFGYFAIPLTILWIIAITNAINLIDGLDGLAAGVSTIALLTLSGMAIIMGTPFVAAMAAILAASTLGFLVFNFYPAKIFMGDTGALFLGYMISVLALLGFKGITMFALIIPIIMLGVPISDTFFAIVRRYRSKQPLMAPDKSHLHHCLLNAGFTHRQTVLIIYSIAAMFGIAALIFSQATMWGAILLLVIMLVAIELFVEAIGLAGKNYRPLINLVKTIGKS
ncbi:undecaprenyl/decaprenyl-phosphate alpha-N-acetylglucosaminyl 1-phosphate transferase [Psychrobacillus sp. INOP01]|uniref:glycosyltransferase family 4 protein n=1 Tax=Psychrobacillus sp. INOP01 TaxID=2829187 RepID=UPI001BAC846C|nr:MraY family glycosyltransferase [Psychrobacillus sp. INOP01]QUG40774.1 undecaprenyl/decaprenyl-phosphate alpha-N-acetylglucosaminyl 1-phosphate transferase [Psychrobacillus sp. INOP01]